MTALRLALSELRRLTAGRMPRLAVLAIVLIPTMYASLYLWANHDPYGKLASVQAALVVEDVPADSAQSGTVHAGRDVARDLVEDGSFDWQEVGSDEAAAGVEDGTYLFALTIPRGFSTALASTADFDPAQGTLILTTNEANNYLSSTIAEQVLTKVSSSIAENVSERAASSFLLGFSTLHDQLKEAGEGAETLADGLVDAHDGAQRLSAGATELSAGEARLVEGQHALGAGLDDAATGAGTLASGADTLSDGAGELASGARQVADGNAELATVADRIAEASARANGDLDTARADIAERLAASGLDPAEQEAILASLDDLRQPLDDLDERVQTTTGQIDELADGADRVASGAGELRAGATRLSDGAGTLRDGLQTARDGNAELLAGQTDARDGAAQLADGAGTLASGLESARDGSRELADGLADGVRSIPDLSEQRRDETARTIASPIRTEDVAQASADSYGAGLAPFFLAIGAWVGGYVMFLLVRPLSNRAIAARQSPWRTALGGWLTPAALAAAQVLIMLAVVMSVVGIDVLRATQVAFFLLLVGAAFVAIVHALNAWLGPVGQLLGLVLLVLQLASAGGTFPWQTLPPTLQSIHHVLPMTYAIDGIRHLMYGANLDSLPRDIAVLAAYVVGGVAISAGAAYRRRIWRVSQIKPEIAL
ncbi:ABC transporter [Aeromicrobium flavum]|uniref:ABC transporter n=1 Tax=Aeromicrobium flavum TaxID=416568 RepID=A0A512HWG1_9ACTN|nr:YhgE/Pip domain-containing protein [Aeromicrobium flavum]GEO89787.1 ABC transporter [Aeromicrobium flavum]